MIFISSTRTYLNCPVHDHSYTGALIRFDFSLMELCEWIRDNMNDRHLDECVVVAKHGLFPFQIIYEHGHHSFHTCYVSFKNYRKFPISIVISLDSIEIKSNDDWMDWEYVEEELELAVKDFEKDS